MTTQTWSIIGPGSEMYEGGDDIIATHVPNPTQAGQIAQAIGLWDDVSAFSAGVRADDNGLAQEARDWSREYWVVGDIEWGGDLPGPWTRVAIADFATTSGPLGFNANPS